MDCPDYSFANPFFKLKTVKTRLAMIQKTQNQKFPFRKLLWILPVLFASLTYTACTSEQEVNQEVDDKMIEFADGGKFQDVTDEEYELIKKIKEQDFLKTKFADDSGYYTPLEDIRANYKNLVAQSISSVDVIKNDNENRIDIKYEDEKLYDAMKQTRFLTKLSSTELSEIMRGYEDGLEIIEEVIEIEEVTPVSSDVDEVPIIQETASVQFAIIENVPTYPGCSGSNAEKKKCMQEKITRLVYKHFDTGLAAKLGISGKHKINTMFKINKDGNVVDIITKAESPELQDEAARVIKMLPKMEPGLQRGKEVNVIYGLPIIFEISE